MTKKELIELLQAGKVDEFDKFRKENPDVEIDLSGADLEDANLYRVNLEDAHLEGTNLHSANFCRANLSGAGLNGADLTNAFLLGACLNGASLCNADLEGANLSEAKFKCADLECANFKNADCRDVDFSCANFSFNHRKEKNVCFYGANLESAIFDNEVLYGSEDVHWLNRAILPNLLGLK